jgi:hypothetical protein
MPLELSFGSFDDGDTSAMIFHLCSICQFLQNTTYDRAECVLLVRSPIIPCLLSGIDSITMDHVQRSLPSRVRRTLLRLSAITGRGAACGLSKETLTDIRIPEGPWRSP